MYNSRQMSIRIYRSVTIGIYQSGDGFIRSRDALPDYVVYIYVVIIIT